ncbi:hypothetical protein JQ641_15835 [Bradyrhizobium sp. JYMT SZCCT0180]|nr:hypothetical protein [Bradyrhizobium sp. JYMT SZCCT0180]MBR1212066.1 hypothetical protein [Bradyrhizobium sp. JYMT SZCCT0180]
MQRRHFTQTAPLEERMVEKAKRFRSAEAKRLRSEAEGIPSGVKRDDLIRRARQIEMASHINEWVSSPGLQAPK